MVSVRTSVPPLRIWIWKPVIGVPPSLISLSRGMVADALPGATLSTVGAGAWPRGVTALEGAESAPRPIQVTARTWNIDRSPLTRLLIALLIRLERFEVNV